MKLHLIAGARPNFMKVAPIYHALSADSRFRLSLVHTGQHYDTAMSELFFTDLALPEPDYHLGVNTGSHAHQTAGVMLSYEAVMAADTPDLTIVVGDVNSTLACALTAAKLCVPVAHLEAGLRAHDRSMPEEINRVLTDRLSSLLWTHSEEADTNLRAEGIPETSIERVGNAMIDSLCHLLPRIAERAMHERFGLTARNYMVATFHRPANVDRGPCLREIVAQLQQIARRLPVVWPAHPRTLKALMEAACLRPLENDPNVHLVEPMGYLDFASLVHGSRLVVTDSGGIQEETSYLGIPCLTVRPNTERPVTLRHGTNRLISPQQLVDSVDVVLAGPLRIETQIPYWDGCAAQRVTASLARNFL